MLIYTLLLLAVLLIFSWYRFIYRPMQYFRRQGIPGPKPNLLFGNLDIVKKYKNMYPLMHQDLCKEYGSVCGFFYGRTPALIVADPEIIKHVTIKQFETFADRTLARQFSQLNVRVNGDIFSGMFFQQGEEWRNTRHLLTPSFSAHKTRMMEPLVEISILKLKNKWKEFSKNGKTIDVTEYFSRMSMEIILATAFGRAVDVQNGKGGDLYQAAIEMITGVDTESSGLIKYAYLLVESYPFLYPLVEKLVHWTDMKKTQEVLVEIAHSLVINRQKQDRSSCPNDLLQSMIDASRNNKVVLEDGIMVAQCVMFLLAGYETSSSTLAFITHLLATHPSIQTRLARDIQIHMSKNPTQQISEVAQSVEYLDMVVQESLRLFPPGAMLQRMCKESCIVNGIQMKRGLAVIIPVYHLHRNEELWENPHKFDPDRFKESEKSKRHSCAYIPFGTGPRCCIGTRLALMEIKMALVVLLTTYNIMQCPETEIPLQLKVGLTIAAKNGVKIVLAPRESI